MAGVCCELENWGRQQDVVIVIGTKDRVVKMDQGALQLVVVTGLVDQEVAWIALVCSDLGSSSLGCSVSCIGQSLRVGKLLL